MNKLIAIALVALTASAVHVGTASADFYGYMDDLGFSYPAGKKAGSDKTTSPGDAFYANVETVDVREECDAAGGTLKRKFQGNDFQWVCIL